MTDLVDLPLGKLMAHPDNPRLQMREDVVERLVAEIERNGFGREHALLVRPKGSGYQIISGHHRAEAAERVGLDELPCWVREMDDDEAFMLLVLSNAQGELSSLEIGMHALTFDLAQGKAGGGLKVYADRVGSTHEKVRQLRHAANVLSKTSWKVELADKAYHLFEVSKAPQATWPVLVEALVSAGWTVAETGRHVEQVKAFEISDLVYAEDWLPLSLVVARYLAAPERFTPRAVARLVATASEVEDWLDANEPSRHHEFLDWLVANREGESWDYRAIVAYQQRLLAERWEVAGWHQGDWRKHISELQDGSVRLVLTDPPYGMGYQSGYRYKSDDHAKISSDGSTEDAITETVAALEALDPKMMDDAHLLVFCRWQNEKELADALIAAGYEVRGSLVWVKNNTGMGNLDGTFAPKHERIIHAVKGNPKLYHRAPDVIEASRESSERHPTEKPIDALAPLIEATTAAGQLVADPFAGVASTCVAAKGTGRKWWGCELDEKYWSIGEERLS
jgi:site-specific DNA-methyltransferase (adenine-specific)